MATIRTLKESITICMNARITPFIWGRHGLGKSSVVRQLAAAGNMGFIDMRASQIEASDLRGLPDKVDGRTVYLPPADMPYGDYTDQQALENLLGHFRNYPEVMGAGDPAQQHQALLALIEVDIQAQRVYNDALKRMQPHFERGILFLDELNRAQDDVQQAAFQLVLDREVGQYSLPPGWSIVTAGNFTEGYQTSGFTDAAFLDRFCHLTLSSGETTAEEWIMYMSERHGANASSVIEFASQNNKYLDGESVPTDLGFTITPSRRSWEAVVRVDEACSKGKFDETSRSAVLAGLIGMDVATSYVRYDCPVKPRDLIRLGVKHHKSQLQSLNRGQIIGLMWGIVSMVMSKDEKTGDKDSIMLDRQEVSETCLDFAEWLVGHSKDKDIAVAFCRQLVSGGGKDSNDDRARAAVISNPKLAQMLSKLNKKNGGKETFIDKITSRPSLQSVLANTAWGTE